ncbi:MAG: divalent-cation tolerance protein CutA [Alphaproteobacteria bacterium]|nr:divalent-cation tolerance protein CutA [Alphaproteobacteria bacterium]
MEFRMLYVTAANATEAERIAEALVVERLAACANILPAVASIYRWRGKVEHAREVVVIAKTRAECAAAAIARVKELHSYEVPGVVALPIDDGNPDYLRWLAAETQPPADR